GLSALKVCTSSAITAKPASGHRSSPNQPCKNSARSGIWVPHSLPTSMGAVYQIEQSRGGWRGDLYRCGNRRLDQLAFEPVAAVAGDAGAGDIAYFERIAGDHDGAVVVGAAVHDAAQFVVGAVDEDFLGGAVVGAHLFLVDACQ